MAKVLLEVDDVLGDHDRVLDVRLHPLQALDALVASVPETVSQQWTNFLHDFHKKFLTQISHSLLEGITGASSLTNMDCSVHKVVIDNGKLEDDTDQMIQKHQLYLPKRKKEKR